MPYIKVISVRNSVAGCMKYIANPDKTEKQLYISSLNCSENISVAEKEFCLTYQHYSHKNFYAPASDNGKSLVKAFHIIQSFKAGECTAETAHKIGLEWVQSVFGKIFQAVICTHTDREHIHNHICLCPYDLDGIKFNSNKKSLERIRKISDDICRNYGICEMEKLTNDKTHIPVGVCYCYLTSKIQKMTSKIQKPRPKLPANGKKEQGFCIKEVLLQTTSSIDNSIT